MTIYLLSQRGVANSPAHSTIYELESILIRTCEAQLITPRIHPINHWLNDYSLITPFTKRMLKKTNQLYQLDHQPSVNPNTSNTLLLICMNGGELSILSAVPDWRKKFDRVVAYVIDAWFVQSYPKQVQEIDCLFVPILELVDELKVTLKIPVELLPLGSDVLTYGSLQTNRPIDVMSFGRTPLDFHRRLSYQMNQPHSNYTYYRHQHPTSAKKANYPEHLDYEKRVDCELRWQFHKMMSLSKIVLAFDSLYNVNQIYASGNVNDRPWKFRHSIIAFRWFEGCAAGCVILGKRPSTSLFEKIMNWEDSTIELPEDTEQWISFTLDFLKDKPRLDAIRKRNYYESLTRHDWRHRIQSILQTLEIKIPDSLLKELTQIQQSSSALS